MLQYIQFISETNKISTDSSRTTSFQNSTIVATSLTVNNNTPANFTGEDTFCTMQKRRLLQMNSWRHLVIIVTFIFVLHTERMAQLMHTLKVDQHVVLNGLNHSAVR